eukprot:6074797-Amphidinium_carterae.1
MMYIRQGAGFKGVCPLYHQAIYADKVPCNSMPIGGNKCGHTTDRRVFAKGKRTELSWKEISRILTNMCKPSTRLSSYTRPATSVHHVRACAPVMAKVTSKDPEVPR